LRPRRAAAGARSGAPRAARRGCVFRMRACGRRAPSLAPWSLVADARVNQRVDQIDEKVDEDENERSEHDEALDHRIVALADRLDKELADAVEIENLLGHHEPAHQERELEAEDG